MVKICDSGIVKPFCLIYEKYDDRDISRHLEKANVLPVHRNESRQIKKNYRPISLLPICGKIFD